MAQKLSAADLIVSRLTKASGLVLCTLGILMPVVPALWLAWVHATWLSVTFIFALFLVPGGLAWWVGRSLLRLSKRRSVSAHVREEPVKLSAVPDKPVGWGYKTFWFAVRTEQGAAVADALQLSDRRQANWATGLQAAYAWSGEPGWRGDVFVTPPVEGWVFAIGGDLPSPVDAGPDAFGNDPGKRFREIFGALAARFPDVQYFGSHRVTGFDAWARAREGRLERSFCISDGDVWSNFGPQSKEEAALGFPDLGLRTAPQARDYIFELAEAQSAAEEAAVARGLTRDQAAADSLKGLRGALPNEQWTVDLAGAWSLDPTRLEQRDGPIAVGIVGKLAVD